MLWVAVDSYRTCGISQARGKLHQLTTGYIVNRQLPLFLGEGFPILVRTVPANGDPVPS